MKKFRVYELSKELKTTNEKVMEILQKNGIEVKNSLNSVDEKARSIVMKALAPSKEVSKEVKKKPMFRTVRFDTQGRPKGTEQGTEQKKSYSSYVEESEKPKAAVVKEKEAKTQETPKVVAPAAEKPEKAVSEVKKNDASNHENSKVVNQKESKDSILKDNKKNQSAQSEPMNQKKEQGQTQGQNKKSNRTAGNERPQRNDRNMRNDRNGRNDRNERGDRSAHGGERSQRNDRNRRDNDRRNGGNRPYGERTERSNYGNRQGRDNDRMNHSQGDRSRNDRNGKHNDRKKSGLPVLDEAPVVLPSRRERPEKKKTRKDYERSRQEKEGSSLMARSLNQDKKKKRNSEKKAASYPTEIQISGSLTVKELAEKMGREVSELIKQLMTDGVMATINQNLDEDTITILAEEFGVTVVEAAAPEDPTEYVPEEDDSRFLKERPPIVTIMGHVDHGKTTLLDALRSTNVAMHEAGGITQSIGAYQIRYNNRKITFLDTPGHEAFTAMRSRGAQLTDIAVLIVAADDGVMPQTVEAIHHAKSAGVPIIVAINKIDKPGANPDRIKEELSHEGLLAEDWGGDIIMVPISAKKKEGLDDLLDNILLVAEIQELKANPNREAYGVVVEAELDKGRGPVMNVLVQNGTLRVGDGILAGKSWGRVRAMTNEVGRKMKSAEPSVPVEILGMDSVPEAGDHFYVMDAGRARHIAELRASRAKEEEQRNVQKVTLDNIFDKIKEGEMKQLDIIVKADVQGSVEALVQSFQAIKNEEVRISIVHSAVGGINESDVMLADASNALIIGFNVRPDANARAIAERDGVDIRTYRVIYDAIDDVKAAMAGLLSPTIKEVVLGHAEIRQVIHTPKVIVAGCYVQDGKITNNCMLRIVRDGIVIHEGKIASLRRFKDDVKEVTEGFECGISIDSYRDVKEGDQLEAFKQVEEAAELE